MLISTENVDIAIGLTIGAGLSTAIGASVVIFPSLIKVASERGLALSLGVSAGVMLYVSFVKIFSESIESFKNSGIEKNRAYQFTTLCFFIGVCMMLLLDFLVKYIHSDYSINKMSNINTKLNTQRIGNDKVVNENVTSPQCIGCSEDPVRELDYWKNKFLTKNNTYHDQTRTSENVEVGGELGDIGYTPSNETSPHNYSQDCITILETDINKDLKRVVENTQLVRIGFNTAIAITLHNIPEGLAMFFGTLDEPAVGASIAVATVLHNIPLGLCIALPIYYATGNRRVAFLWGACSGTSEPLSAIVVWAIVRSALSESLYGVLFGLVAGMMVIISVKELLPTAHRFDPMNIVTSYSFIAGMVGMCLPLIIFTF